jgi:hypothetical protein
VLLLLAASSGVEAQTRVYYSVGTSRSVPTDLKSGSPTVTIAGGIATFSVAQPDNVGVGDEIAYGGVTSYISGRLSSIRYTVTTRLGAPADDRAATTVTSIYRAFASLVDAADSFNDGTHLDTSNLVTGNYQVNLACYNDGVMSLAEGAGVLIEAHTTGPANYIKVYTPVSTSEVGVSQRHRGGWGTGFQLSGSNAATIRISDDYVRIEGLAVLVTVTNDDDSWGAIWSAPYAAASDVRISHNIVKGNVTDAPYVSSFGIAVGEGDSDVSKVWDNIVFDFPVALGTEGVGIAIDRGTGYVFNNTVYNCQRGIANYPSSTGSVVKNNVSINDVFNGSFTDYYPATGFAGTRSNNVSSDTTSETIALRNMRAYATYFENTTSGSEDLHITDTSLALWGSSGADLSADLHIQVTDDIDGSSRGRPDIGADECFGAISIADASVAEGDAGATVLTFDLTLAKALSDTVTVQWATANDTATDGDGDYVPASGTVTFPPLATAATLQVTVNGDLKQEPDERFFVNLASPQRATLADAQAVGTILNDDFPRISIGDVQVLEGQSGYTAANFTITLSYPSIAPVSIAWATSPGTATSPEDFITTGGTVTFPIGVVTRTVTVDVVGDTTWDSGLPSETFYVELSSPSGGTILKGTGLGVIINDDDPNLTPTVSALVVVSDGDAAYGRDRLHWINPNPGTPPQGIRIKSSHGPSCTTPSGPTPPDTWQDASATDTIDLDLLPSDAGKPMSTSHETLVLLDEYCYAVWAWYGGTTFSTDVAVVNGRPFTPGKIKWKYILGSGMTTVAPPTVGQDDVLVPSNDHFVHAMTRGEAGGAWPTTPLWTPPNLGSPAQERSPIIPLASGTRAYYATQDGWVHAIDTRSGAVLWESYLGAAAQAAPAGIFTAFGGKWDYLLVGTREGSGNRFYALDPFTGAVVDVFPQGTESGVSGLGPISAMAAVDYGLGRVYFGTKGGTAPDAPETLWCLELGPPYDALRLRWRLGPPAGPGDIYTSPVVRGTRLYVADVNGLIWSVGVNGDDVYPALDLGDGAIKGFPFPDRASTSLFVATSTSVWGLTDDPVNKLKSAWQVPALNNPSVVLFRPRTSELYVGVEDIGTVGGPDFAGLLRIDVGTGSIASSLPLEDFVKTIGAPSLDVGVTPNLLHVGSDGGVVYAVEAPF